MSDHVDMLRAQLEQSRAERAWLDEFIAWLEQGVAIHEREPGAPAPGGALAAVPAAAKSKPVAPRNAQQRDRDSKVLSVALRANTPVALSQVIEATGLPEHQAQHTLKRLVTEGRLIATGSGRWRRYQPAPRDYHSEHRARTEAPKVAKAQAENAGVARVKLRDRVLTAIAADSDALTEDRLAAALGASRDDIADATGWLLERDRVHLNPDGTYRRNGASPAVALTVEGAS